MAGAWLVAVLSALLAFAAGCGETEQRTPSSAETDSIAHDCDDAPPAGELALLSETSSDVTMGPCGELSYVADGRVFLVDASLSSPELLEGATAPAHFDPHGRALFYLADADGTLVYRDLRGPVAWSAALPALSAEDSLYDAGDRPIRALDFYAKGDESGLFRCQGTTLYDYDQAGHQSAHEVGILCPRVRYSGLDALLIGPTPEGYRGLKLGKWEPYALTAIGECDADSCQRELVRQVVVKDLFRNQLMGDVLVPVPAGTQYYDAETGAEVDSGAVTTPDRGVVTVPGAVLDRDEARTFAVTYETGAGEATTSVHYSGPDPMAPSRWLTARFTLQPSRGKLNAVAARDLRRIALWSDECESERRTLLTFAPGREPASLEVAHCVTRVDWVGSDGTLLAEVRDAELATRLALIFPDGRVLPIEVELLAVYGVRQAVSDGRALAITTGYQGPLHLIDLQTGASRELAPQVERLFTDRAHERLAFRVSSASSGGPNPLWAGAFPH
jgi:hypothetical protein